MSRARQLQKAMAQSEEGESDPLGLCFLVPLTATVGGCGIARSGSCICDLRHVITSPLEDPPWSALSHVQGHRPSRTQRGRPRGGWRAGRVFWGLVQASGLCPARPDAWGGGCSQAQCGRAAEWGPGGAGAAGGEREAQRAGAPGRAGPGGHPGEEPADHRERAPGQPGRQELRASKGEAGICMPEWVFVSPTVCISVCQPWSQHLLQ